MRRIKETEPAPSPGERINLKLPLEQQQKTAKETAKKRVNGEKGKEESQECAILVQNPRKARVLRRSSVLHAAKVEYDEGRTSVNVAREWPALNRTV